MAALLFILGIAALLVGANRFFAVYRQVASRIPLQFQDVSIGGLAVKEFVWDTSVPVSARRQFLASLVLLAAALALMGGAAFLYGQPLGGVAFGGFSAFYVVSTVRMWIKHRDLL
jgi:uncharacterized membrane protein YidH (DUF202 family)